MHAQQDAARFLQQEKEANIFSLKGNQPSIQAKAQALLNSAFPPRHPAQARTAEKSHGRLKVREIWALDVTPEQMGFTARKW